MQLTHPAHTEGKWLLWAILPVSISWAPSPLKHQRGHQESQNHGILEGTHEDHPPRSPASDPAQEILKNHTMFLRVLPKEETIRAVWQPLNSDLVQQMQILCQAMGFPHQLFFFFLHVGNLQTRSVLFLPKHLLRVLFLEKHVIVWLLFMSTLKDPLYIFLSVLFGVVCFFSSLGRLLRSWASF